MSFTSFIFSTMLRHRMEDAMDSMEQILAKETWPILNCSTRIDPPYTGLYTMNKLERQSARNWAVDVLAS